MLPLSLLLLFVLFTDFCITKGKVFPILINKLIFLSESNLIPLLVFSMIIVISYNPPSERSLLLIIAGFAKLTWTISFLDKCSCSLFIT